MIRRRLSIVSMLLIGVMLVMGSVVHAGSSDEVRREVQKAEEKLTKLERERVDEEKKEQANLKAQRNAGKEALESLKKEAKAIAKRLNTIRDQIESTLVLIDQKRGELRSAAAKASADNIATANGQAGKKNKGAARDALRDAKREIKDWKDSVVQTPLYQHHSFAKLRDATSSLEKAEAQSELNALAVGLKLLQKEQERLTAESKSLKHMAKAGTAAKLLQDTWTGVETVLDELKTTLDTRSKTVDQRVKDYRKRQNELAQFTN